MITETSSTMPPVTPATAVPPTKSKLPIVVTVVILLCLIGGGIFAYNNMSASPTKVLKDGLKKSLDVTSFSVVATSTGRAESSMGNGIPSTSDFTVNLRGSVDFKSLDAVLLDATLAINASGQATTSNGSLLLGMDVKYLAKNIYLNLKDFTASYTSTGPEGAETQMLVAMANGFASSLKNKWIQIDVSNASKATSTASIISDEDKKILKDYIAGMNYITEVKNLGKENINDVSTNHIQVTMQHGQELLDIIRKMAIKQGEQGASLEEFMAEVSKVVTQKVDLDLWIGRSDSLIYKIVSSPIVMTDDTTGTKTTTSQEMVFSNHNAPVAVTAPADAVPLEKMIESMFGGMIGGPAME